MLVLTRAKDEEIIIYPLDDPDNPLTITVVGIKGERVRLGITADRKYDICRAEIDWIKGEDTREKP